MQFFTRPLKNTLGSSLTNPCNLIWFILSSDVISSHASNAADSQGLKTYNALEQMHSPSKVHLWSGIANFRIKVEWHLRIKHSLGSFL